MDLVSVWFYIITLFWLGYVFLEGFDFGVGMLIGLMARNDIERRVLINTIGPVWDGNETWLVVAAGVMFAAFPLWYASLFSADYLPLLAVLLALICRGVAFEYRGKVDSPRWRKAWDFAIIFGSWVPPLGVGLVLSTTVLGLPLDANGNRVGSLLVAFQPQFLLGALAFAGFSLVHGSVYVSLKTVGDIRQRARKLALRVGPIALIPLVALLAVVQYQMGKPWTIVPLVVAVVAAGLALLRLAAGREGQAFALLGVAITAAVVTSFGALYPDVMPSTLNHAYSLTVNNASSSHYTLIVMSWIAAFGAPAVVIYQAWSYWVFRRRIGTQHIPAGTH